MVGLAIITGTPPWSAVSLESLAKKALCGGEILPLAKPDINRVTGAITGAVEILPLASDRTPAEVELLQQERGLEHRTGNPTPGVLGWCDL